MFTVQYMDWNWDGGEWIPCNGLDRLHCMVDSIFATNTSCNNNNNNNNSYLDFKQLKVQLGVLYVYMCIVFLGETLQGCFFYELVLNTNRIKVRQQVLFWDVLSNPNVHCCNRFRPTRSRFVAYFNTSYMNENARVILNRDKTNLAHPE